MTARDLVTRVMVEHRRVLVPLGVVALINVGLYALLVYPRLADLDEVFTDAGGQTPGGRQLLLRRTTGFELHSVREYEQGESLRRVHWPSTAKRGQLMVK